MRCCGIRRESGSCVRFTVVLYIRDRAARGRAAFSRGAGGKKWKGCDVERKRLLLAHGDGGVVVQQTRGTDFCGGVVLLESRVSGRAALREDEGYATG